MVHRSIRNLTESDIWQLEIEGQTRHLDFTKAREIDRPLLKRWLVDLLREISPQSANSYFYGVMSLGQTLLSDLLDDLITNHPSGFRIFWMTYLFPRTSIQQVRALRSLCRTFCKHGYGQWSPDHLDFVSNLKGHALDKYAVVRRGDCFVDLYDQSTMVQSLDGLAARISAGKAQVGFDTRGAIALVLSFQHGLRSGQIARVKVSGVTIFPTGAVHVRFPVTKQRKDASAQERVRSIRREWCPIFAEFQKRRPANDNSPYFLGCSPPKVKYHFWNLTDLRHTAGQRLADSGASHLAISEFMNHADLATALVYIKGSPTQAKRINKALGASDIYSVVADAARTSILSRKDLDATPEANVISGIMHGIPMSGIGACKAEVGLCSRSPVISCYTCHKFLALSETDIHEEVASILRQVVLDFAKMVRPGETSPAMTQLRATLEAIESLTDQLRKGGRP
jgi:integrase